MKRNKPYKTNIVIPETEIDEVLEKAYKLLDKGKTQSAEKLVLEFLKKYPQNQFAYMVLGVISGSENKYNEAISYFDKAISIDPEFTEAWFNKAITHQNMNEYGKAIKAFQKVVETGSSDDSYVYESIEFLEALSKELKENSGISLNEYAAVLIEYEKGIKYLEDKKWEKAVKSFENVISIDPRNAAAYGNLGICMIELGQVDKARDALNKALEIFPDYLSALNKKKLLDSLEKGELSLAEAKLLNSREFEAFYQDKLIEESDSIAGTYSEEVSRLFSCGDCREMSGWPDYLHDLGLNESHIPELIKIATDEDLYFYDSESMEVWAPVHAWRALGQLRAEQAIEPLISQFRRIDEDDDDWADEDISEALSMIGHKAIPHLKNYLQDMQNGLYARAAAISSIVKIAQKEPHYRNETVNVLTQQLQLYNFNDRELNGFVVGALVDLKAVESIDLIRRAYREDCVEEFIMGDIKEVESVLGLRVVKSSFEYLNDDFPSSEHKHKIGRNDPCPCGSGKKYKNCHMNK